MDITLGVKRILGFSIFLNLVLGCIIWVVIVGLSFWTIYDPCGRALGFGIF